MGIIMGIITEEKIRLQKSVGIYNFDTAYIAGLLFQRKLLES